MDKNTFKYLFTNYTIDKNDNTLMCVYYSDKVNIYKTDLNNTKIHSLTYNEFVKVYSFNQFYDMEIIN
jgi:hypothetical protein